MKCFAAFVMTNETLASRLAGNADDDAFIAEAMAQARAHDLAMPAGLMSAVRGPDAFEPPRCSPPLCAGSALPPRHWLPVAIAAAPEGMAVDWAWLGPQPLRASFYEDEIRRALALPFNRAFRYRIGLDDLIRQTAELDSLQPDGFIFHMSRCGSTLVAQMLAALDDSIVISEAAPIDTVLQSTRAADPDVAAQALRAIIAAFGRKRAGNERRYVVKLDAWHTLALPMFRRAFPDVPWVFLYRDPVEVLVSQMRQLGLQMVPQYFPPSFFGIAAEACSMDDDYCARVLAAVCGAVLDHHASGGGLLLNYRQLPEAVCTAILPHFGIAYSERERAHMHRAAQQDAKTPSLPFAADSAAKQRAATAPIRLAADRHLGAIYNRLEALRTESGRRQGVDAV